MDLHRGIPLVIGTGKVISFFLSFHFLIYVQNFLGTAPSMELRLFHTARMEYLFVDKAS